MTAQSNLSRRTAPALTMPFARLARQAWRRYWDWRARKATVEILHSLDTRTLRDIGLAPSEIESVVYGNPDDRRHHYYELWHSRRGC
jgi:uncharacterized protein YjiS (DUF1127 family)